MLFVKTARHHLSVVTGALQRSGLGFGVLVFLASASLLLGLHHAWFIQYWGRNQGFVHSGQALSADVSYPRIFKLCHL